LEDGKKAHALSADESRGKKESRPRNASAKKYATGEKERGLSTPTAKGTDLLGKEKKDTSINPAVGERRGGARQSDKRRPDVSWTGARVLGGRAVCFGQKGEGQGRGLSSQDKAIAEVRKARFHFMDRLRRRKKVIGCRLSEGRGKDEQGPF